MPILRSALLNQESIHERIVLRNVYGTPVPEILRCAQGSAFALTSAGGGYVPVWHTAPVSCSSLAAADLDADGAQEVVVVTKPASGAGSVLIYTPHLFGPPRASTQVPGTLGVNDVAVGDVDGDPAPEIVAVTDTDAYVLDAATLAVDWTAAGRGGHTVEIADLEGDGPAEIIIGSTDGHVLNGTARTYKWGYAGGFGRYFAVGDVDGDGRPEIVGTPGTHTINILNGDSFQTSSFVATGIPDLRAIGVGDGNGDGQLEIEAGSTSGLVRGFKTDGTTVWAINAAYCCAAAIAIGDVDGNGRNDAVWTAGSYVHVGNPPEQTVDWLSLRASGFLRSVAADLDRDGTNELVVASYASQSATGTLRVLDRQGNVLRSLPVPSGTSIASIAAGQLDGDAALEVVLLSENSTYSRAGRMYILDGVSGQLEWSSPTTPEFMSRGRLAVRNVDGDALDEIFVMTSDNGIQVLDGATGFVQGSFIPPPYVNDFDLADVDGDSDLDLVVGAGQGYYVLNPADLSERSHTTVAGNVMHVAATAGSFAISIYDNSSYPGSTALVEYAGSDFQERWRCSNPGLADRLRYATIGGAEWLAWSDATALQFFASGGSSCPGALSADLPLSDIQDLSFADVTADGNAELLVSRDNTIELNILGLGSAARGDADGDGLLSDDDLHALARYFYGDGIGISAGGDTNGDFALRPDDLIKLIDIRRGTGNAAP